MNKSFSIFISIVLMTLLLFSTILSSRLVYGNNMPPPVQGPATDTNPPQQTCPGVSVSDGSGNCICPDTNTLADANGDCSTSQNPQSPPTTTDTNPPGSVDCVANPSDPSCPSPNGNNNNNNLLSYCDTHTANAFCQSLAGSTPTPGTSPCIKPAAYIVDTSSNKSPCPITPQKPASPPGCAACVQSIINDVVGGDGTETDPNGYATWKANPDGSITTTNPDGSTTTSWPAGTVGTRDSGFLNGAFAGLILTKSPDGTTSAKYPSGRTITSAPDGTVTTTTPDGLATTKSPDGTESTTRPDGSSITDKPDGTVITFNPSDGSTITTKPDGTKTTQNKDGSWNITFPKKPDGSFATYYSDGRTTITH
jgi:hypothetical protein